MRRIRARLPKARLLKTEVVAKTPDSHHHIGKSQNDPVHIGTFVRERNTDPAVKVRVAHWIPNN